MLTEVEWRPRHRPSSCRNGRTRQPAFEWCGNRDKRTLERTDRPAPTKGGGAGELPACWALFQQGRLGEDAMVRIARRVPAGRDPEVAALAPGLLIAQLDRLLRSLPEQPDGDPRPTTAPERLCRLRERPDGWLRGEFCLPPDEAALVTGGLTAARDAEFRDRHDLDPDMPVDPEDPTSALGARSVSWADGLVRMATEATDALDRTLQRTGSPGDRHQIVLHHDVDPDGNLGTGQLHLGPVVPDPVARYLACDAQVMVATYRIGQLIGIHPTVRAPNRAMRRALERRDQGCVHPLCTQRRWLHAHHIQHWRDGGELIIAATASYPASDTSLPGRRAYVTGARRRRRRRRP